MEEEKMIAIKRSFVMLLAVVVLSAGASLTQAQRETYRGTSRALRQLILRIETRTDAFHNSLNAQTRIKTVRGETLDNLAQDLNTAVVQLHQRFDRRTATAGDAQEVLNRAALIDRFMAQRSVRNAAVVRSWSTLRADLNQLATIYNLSWPSIAVGEPYPNNRVNRLTGTYRLDPSQSDDPAQAADRATQSLPYGNRARLRDQLAARLASPDQIAIDLREGDNTGIITSAPNQFDR